MCRSVVTRALVFCFILHSAMLGFTQAALAAPIGTQTLLEIEQRTARVDRIQSFLAREHVRATLMELGVNTQEAQARIAVLTDDELRMLEQRIDTLPAGGTGVFVVVGVVFVVLLVLELVGVTNVFTKL